MDDKRKSRTIGVILVVLTGIKLCTSLGLSLYGLSNSGYDDMLFINQAQAMSSGNWLGEFSKTTLLKRPMYTIFLTLIGKCNLSYKFAVQALYILAVILFVYVIGQIFKNKIGLAMIYTVLLFSPAMYAFTYVQRVYRMALIPSATLFVVTGFIQMFYLVHVQEPKWKLKMCAWSVWTGLSFFFFWNLREDSVWILPFAFCASLISAGVLLYLFVQGKKKEEYKYYANGKLMLTRCGFLLLPFVILFIGNSGIKYMNYRNYGVYTDSEMTSSQLAKLMSTIYSVESDEEYEYVNVDKDTFYKIYEVSPTMQTLQPYFDQMWEGGWTMDNGQIAGGYIAYAFRDVLKKAGYYEGDATAKEAICKQMNDEIKQAIREGKLETKGGLFSVSFLMGKKGANLELFTQKYLESLKWIASYEKLNVHQRKSVGNRDYLRKFEQVTNNVLIYPDVVTTNIKGYMLLKNTSQHIQIFLSDTEGKNKVEIPYSLNSEDVYNYYAQQGEAITQAHNCRFQYTSDNYVNGSVVSVYIDGEETERILLDEMAAMQYETDAYILNFDIADVTIKEDPLYAKGWLNLKICDLLIRVYKILAWPLLALAMISYIVVFVKIFDKGQDKKQKEIMTKAFVVVTGLLLSAMLLAGGVTYRYAEARNSSGRNLYMAGTYPLYHIFVLGSITLFYCFVVSPKLTDRRKRMEKE